MIRQVKQSNSSKLDDFSNILLNQFERFKPFSIRERACRAQSSQNMRAREQNREHWARGLALKSGLEITAFFFTGHSLRSFIHTNLLRLLLSLASFVGPLYSLTHGTLEIYKHLYTL